MLLRTDGHFSVERVGQPGRERWAIRVGLRQINRLGDDLTKATLFTRRPLDEENAQLHKRPFTSLWDLLSRLRPAGPTRDAAETLVWSGACDGLAPRMQRRQRVWQMLGLWPLIDPHLKGTTTRRRRTRAATTKNESRADHPQ